MFQMTFIEPLKLLRRTLGVRSNPGLRTIVLVDPRFVYKKKTG